jgi:hypothetical protein
MSLGNTELAKTSISYDIISWCMLGITQVIIES